MGTPVEAEIGFSMTSHGELRRKLPEPGLLLPVGPEEDEALIRFPAESALLLTGLLLGDAAGLDVPPHPSVLDGISMVAVAEPLAELIFDGFGLDLTPDYRRSYQEEWPLTQPPAGARLLATVSFKVGTSAGTFDLLFPRLNDETLARWAAAAADGLAPSQLKLDLSFLLCRWRSDGRSLASIGPGTEIILPGADLERVDLEIRMDGETKRYARGNVTTRRGRRELTVAQVFENRA
jgi:hypothetical protein